MREILFKAKRLDNLEWVEGDLIQDKDLDIASIIGWNYFNGENGLEREPFEYHVDPSTVCQYTGKTDKNGVKIFECDNVVLECAENFTRKEIETVVFWDDDSASFEPFSWEHSCDECESCFMITSVEVIGNIHDEEE